MIKTLHRKQCWANFPVAMALVCLINRIRGQRNFRCEVNDFLPLPYYSRVSLSCLSVLWDWRGNIRIRASSWCLKSACRKISLSSFQIMSFKDGIPWVSTYNFDKSFTKYFEETPLVHAWSFRAWERARTWIWLILFNPPGQRPVSVLRHTFTVLWNRRPLYVLFYVFTRQKYPKASVCMANHLCN